MKRYELTKVKKVKRKGYQEVTAKSTTIYDNIPESDNDIWVISQYGDRLDLLAYQFYGDTGLWWYIAKANGLKFMVIPVGTSLRIPGSLEYAKGR